MSKQRKAIMEFESVVTKFGNNTVHDGVSFDIYPGSVVSLIGGSGTGKSTLLREALGLLKPTSGHIRLFGKDVFSTFGKEAAEMRQRYGVLFQNGALFSSLTVGENVAVPLVEQKSLPTSIIEDIVYLRLSLCGLSQDVGKKMPSELSGGMRKRVALARALALEPDVLFLDEPTSGLDPINARAFDYLIRTLSDSLGLTVFMVTHDLDSISSITDRVIVLGNGVVIGDGTVGDMLEVKEGWIYDYFSSTVMRAGDMGI